MQSLKEYTTEKIRNIAIVGHKGSGKTSLIEAMLYNCGHTNRLGKVDDGTSMCDNTSEEIKHKTTIQTKVAPCEWSGIKINTLDTPGFSDFTGDILTALKVADAAVIVVCASSGIQAITEKVSKYAYNLKLPRMFYINKVDRENVNFEKLYERLLKKYGIAAAPMVIPAGTGENFEGVIDLTKMIMLEFCDNSGKFIEKEIPQQYKEYAQDYHEKLIESIVESDEKLMEIYLEKGDLEIDEILAALNKGIKKCEVIPIICGSALHNKGVMDFLDIIKEFLPDPAHTNRVIKALKDGHEVPIEVSDSGTPTSYVFKISSEQNLGELSFFRVYSGKINAGIDIENVSTHKHERIGQLVIMRGKTREDLPTIHAGDIAATMKLKHTHAGDTLSEKSDSPVFEAISLPRPVVSVALKPETKKDQEKLASALNHVLSEDPSLKITQDAEFNQTILSGLGETHLEVTLEKIRDRYSVHVETEKAKIPYRETITVESKAQGKYKKQSGGHGQYGDCWLRIEPAAEGHFEFKSEIVGGAIPSKFIPSIEKGVASAMLSGVLAGYPVVNIKATVYDGSFHNVDSSDYAFQIAGSLAFKEALKNAKPILLEPVMEVDISAHQENTGGITSLISSKRGKIVSMETEEETEIVKANIPMSEMGDFAIQFKASTQAKGEYSMNFSHYEQISGKIAETVIKESQESELVKNS